MRLVWGRWGKFALFVLTVLIYVARVRWMDDGRYMFYDDAFISFRYANNLARGYGLVFNPGQHVEGYTNFLWAVMLAIGIWMGGDAMCVAKAAGTACGVGLLALTMLLSGRLVPEAGVWSAFPSLLLAATASLPRYALSGMETLMFSLWLCLALWLEFRVEGLKGRVLAAASLALASLTRPEGVLFFGVLTVAWAVERAWRGEERFTILRDGFLRLLTFGMIYAPYFLWRYTYYGYLLPNTFYAKAGGLSVAAIGRGLRYLSYALLVTNLPLSVCGLLVPLALKRRGVFSMFLTLMIYLVYIVIVGGDDFAVFGPRFALVVFPWLAVLGLIGLVELTFRRPRARSFVVILAISLMILAGGLSIFEAAAYRGVTGTMNRGWWTAAEWLKTHAAIEDTVAVDAAGIIPYHTGLPTIDMLGLNDVRIAHLSVPALGSGHAGHEKFDPDYVLAQRPTYITSWLDSRGRPLSAGLWRVAERLEEQYELVAVILMQPPGSGQPNWLDVSARTHIEELHQCGYIYGIFRLREREP